MNNHGIALKNFLKRNQISRNELSRKTNVRLFTINNMISGKSNRIENYELIAKALDITLDQLLNNDDDAQFKSSNIITINKLINEAINKNNVFKITSASYLSLFNKLNKLIEENNSEKMIEMYIKGYFENL